MTSFCTSTCVGTFPRSSLHWFLCIFWPRKRIIWQAPKHTRKRHTPENASNWPVRKICSLGCVAFSGVLWRPLRGEQRAPENATHPKTQIFGTASYLRFPVCCVFGCSLFSCQSCPLFGLRKHPYQGTTQKLTKEVSVNTRESVDVFVGWMSSLSQSVAFQTRTPKSQRFSYGAKFYTPPPHLPTSEETLLGVGGVWKRGAKKTSAA